MIVYIGGYPRKVALSWYEKYGGIGSLYSPGQLISRQIPFCLDNGAFTNFNPCKFIHHIEKGCATGKPDFIVSPDTVGNSESSLIQWKEWSGCLREFGVPIAFVIQDGQTPESLPVDADLFFLGGSDSFRSRFFIERRNWPRLTPLHVGRINTWAGLWRALGTGATSCDGTGWFRKSTDHWSARDLLLFLKIQFGDITPLDHPSWPFISLEARKSLLDCPSWNLKNEPLFCEEL